jgi:hypothetical protein
MISEARFFRGFYYFMLVQTYGGVPLDLGAGELKYNTLPSNSEEYRTGSIHKNCFADLKKQ